MDLPTICILSCETYFVTRLLVDLEGPFALFSQLRRRAGVSRSELDGQCTWTNEISHALCCRYCTAVYVAAILGVVQQVPLFAVVASLGLVYVLLDWISHGLE